MSYPVYAGYKATRWPEVGSIPSGWEARRLKFSVTLRNEKIEAEGANLDYMGLEHIESWTGKRIEDETASSEGIATRFEKHDVLFGKLRPYLAKVYLAEKEGMATTEALVLMTEPALVPVFLKYLLLSEKFIDAVSGSTFGAKMPRANWEAIGGLPILIPSLVEQQQIAAFLDWKTGQIDALIAKKKELMDKLKEKRLAVITQAVTKGLNPAAPLRDSGISWVGSVPTHWELRKAKYSCEAIIDCKNRTPEYFDDGEFYVVRTTDVKNGRLELSGALRTDVENFNEWTLRGAPQKGDVLFTREAPAGEAALFDGKINICLGQRMMYFRVDQEKLDPRFLLSYIYSHSLQAYISTESGGSTVTHLRLGQVYNLPILQPPIDEQTEIAEYLDSETSKFDLMMEKVQSAIARLTEYRTALITAATTGKIDVRGWHTDKKTHEI